MKNLLVTGGLGFIGSNFIRLLLKDGGFEKIINFDKQTYAGNPENLEDLGEHNAYKFVKADICDQGKVFKALEEFQVDAIINFAAESHVDRSIDGPEPFVQTNVVGTLRLLEAVKGYVSNSATEKKDSFRFLHVSTDEVFGSLKIDDPAFVRVPYALTVRTLLQKRQQTIWFDLIIIPLACLLSPPIAPIIMVPISSLKS